MELDEATGILAGVYGKSCGALVASGQAAIELALEHAEIEAGAEVVVPAECCHLVGAAVARYGARPVFARPMRSLTLSVASLRGVLTDQTRAVIAVHHLGLPCDVRAIREAIAPDVLLLEDAAQAFGLMSRGSPIGAWSDLVVTSFGFSKPLSLGGGGGVFGDQHSLTAAMGRYGPSVRSRPLLPRSFPLHPLAVRALPEALPAAAAQLARRRAVAERVRVMLRGTGHAVWEGAQGDEPAWHRIPVWLDNVPMLSHLALTEPWVQAGELPHKVPSSCLPMFGHNATATPDATKDLFLLRPDDVNLIERWAADLRSLGN